MHTLSIALALFFIMDAIGNLPSYLQMVKELSPQRRRIVVFAEMSFALIAMLAFNFFGEGLFNLLNLSESTVKLASGVILFLITIKIIFPSPTSLRAQLPEGEPYLIPLAIPLIAGPSLLATIMLYARTEESIVAMVVAIVIAWNVSMLILLNAGVLQRGLGANGLIACERLTGMLLILMAVQRFLEGVQKAIQDVATK